MSLLLFMSSVISGASTTLEEKVLVQHSIICFIYENDLMLSNN